MKILFITDLYPIKPGETATPLTLHNFVFEWIKQGHEVTVVKPNFIFNSFLRGKPFYKTDFYNYEGVKVFNVNYFTPFLFQFMEKIPKEIRFANYDVVIGHMPSGVIFANKIARIIRKPLICGVHISDIEVLTNSAYEIYFKAQMIDAYNRAKKIACRSIAVRKKFNNVMPNYAAKTFVASSGINPDFINQTCNIPISFKPSPFVTNHKILKVVTCANLIKRKNVDKLILAIGELDGFELKIIGDGSELASLKAMNAKNVEFLGRLPHEKVLEEMRKSDIFVLPSVNESFGMVYLEAMASGCVTVCTKDDGIDGILKDEENGFLCEPTTESIKNTLLKIKNFDNISEIVKNGLEIAKAYSLENCADNYLQRIQN